jgi:hypothetical protein
MKNISCITVSLLFFFLLFSRNDFKAQAPIWIQNNAVWHYDFENNLGNSGFLKIRYIGDTIMNGQTAQILTTTRYLFMSDQNDISHLISITELDTNYTWNNQNQVFYWRENQFELLYDFTTLTGESYTIDSDEDQTFFCNSISTANVMSTGTVSFGNQTYPTMELTYSPGDYTRLEGSYNARFGNQSSTGEMTCLFPVEAICQPGVIMEYASYKFRCFQDDSLTVNPSSVECEYQLTHVGMNDLTENGFQVFPNPAANFVTLISPFEQNEVQIFNVAGQLVKSTQTTSQLQELHFELSKGTYTMKVFAGHELRFTEKLVVQ